MPDHRKIVLNQMRPLIHKRDGNRCVYCGRGGLLVLDHDLPRSRGGLDVAENLITACTECNSSKGAKTGEEYREWRRERGLASP